MSQTNLPEPQRFLYVTDKIVLYVTSKDFEDFLSEVTDQNNLVFTLGQPPIQFRHPVSFDITDFTPPK